MQYKAGKPGLPAQKNWGYYDIHRFTEHRNHTGSRSTARPRTDHVCHDHDWMVNQTHIQNRFTKQQIQVLESEMQCMWNEHVGNYTNLITQNI